MRLPSEPPAGRGQSGRGLPGTLWTGTTTRRARAAARPGGAGAPPRRGALLLALGLALGPGAGGPRGDVFARGGAEDDPSLLGQGLETITAGDVKKAVEFFTSDACAGRDTPQAGLAKACDFVAERFKEAGLEPLGDQEGSYFRHYPLEVIDVGDATSLVVAGNDLDDVVCTPRVDFVPAARSPDGVAEGEVVFAGYGIQERKFRWDSYKKVDARGKIVIVLTREPTADVDNKRFFEGKEMTDTSSVEQKAKVAAAAGAVALLITGCSRQEGEVWLGSQHPRLQGRGRRGQSQELALPVAIISPELAERILGRAPVELRDAIDGKKRPETFPVDGVRVRLEVALEETSAQVPNVVARYPGRDPDLLGEVVVVGAHLDHIGVDDRGRIRRGADDNAGGVAGMLEVAEAFGRTQPVTRRSVVFIAFTGEEHGLLGSRAYVRDPAIPMTSTYGMINLDIISRGRPREIEATPPPQETFLDKLMSKAVKASQCRLKVGQGGKEFFQRSDQFSFHEAGVPTVFFNEGVTNEDYHRFTDTPDKILDDKIERVARLSYALAWMAANSDLKGGLK